MTTTNKTSTIGLKVIIGVCKNLMLLALSGCAAYSSKGSCSDARGLPCQMMHQIDRKIDSGEAEKVYETCDGKSCSQKPFGAKQSCCLPKTGASVLKAKINKTAQENSGHQVQEDGYVIIKD